MKEKLKRLEKLEKSQKGHDAMTEELKRMEEETGLDVRERFVQHAHPTSFGDRTTC